MPAEACRAAARAIERGVQGHEGCLSPACHGLQVSLCSVQKPSDTTASCYTVGFGIRVMTRIQVLQRQLWLPQGWQGQPDVRVTSRSEICLGAHCSHDTGHR